MFGLIPKRLLAAALMFFQLGFHVAHAELSETWVDDDWADLVSGASVDGHTFGADAFAQIQAGIDAAASNGVVHVAPGIYPGGVHLPSRPITLRSDAGTEVTIIDGSGGREGVIFDPGATLESIIDGFTIRNASLEGHANGILCESSSATVRNCTLYGNVYGFGVYSGSCIISNVTATDGFFGQGGFYTILRSRFGQPSSPADITCWSPQGLQIADSRIYGFVNAISYESSEITIQNNFIDGNGTGIYLQSDYVPVVHILIANNTLINGGVSFGAATGSIEVVNNIVYQAPVPFSSQTEICDLHNNDFWPALSATNWVGTNGNLSVPPQFVNEALGDYHLCKVSPCVGAGTLSNAPKADLNGEARPSPTNSLPDMGAFETGLEMPPPDPSRYFGVGVGDYQDYSLFSGKHPHDEGRSMCSRIDTNTFGYLTHVVDRKRQNDWTSTIWHVIDQDGLRVKRIQTPAATVTFNNPLVYATYPHVGGTNFTSVSTMEEFPGVVELRASVGRAKIITVQGSIYSTFRIQYRLKQSVGVGKSRTSRFTYWYSPYVGVVRTKVGKELTELTAFHVGGCP